ncbi:MULTISPECIES: hypothetical protein [Staphylococcus]|uniref:hypothetical protein n=1 Tax=Staphylococcus TaxID=1279 RepID=UPI00288449EC|nr:hypothetical protein [Staphylococcus chromogenes]MDT0655114.1 hypothetical protein [Staphylococcus chromogenes]
MKNSKRDWTLAVCVLIIAIIIVLTSTYLAIQSTISFERVKNTLPIMISIISLFTTFGGAYLGAEISGHNARELFEKDIKLRDIENHLSANIKVLEKINESTQKLFQLKEIVNKDNYYHPYNLRKCADIINKVNSNYDEIKDKHLYNASLIIYIDFEELHKRVKTLNIVNEFNNSIKTEELIREELNKEEKLNTSILWNFVNIDESSDTIPVELVSPNNDIYIKNLKIENIYKGSKDKFECIRDNINIGIEKWLEYYETMEFSSIEDFYRMYKEVRT